MRDAFAYWGWLLTISALLFTSCKPQQAPVVVPLVLLAPVTITPSSPSLRLGDTLWLEANFSDSLADWRTGHRYQLQPQDMTLDAAIVIKKLQGIGQPATGAASTLRVVEKVGRLSIGGGTTGVFFFDYSAHTYRAKFGLIPTQAGILSISLLLGPGGGNQAYGSFLPFIHLPPDAQGREQKATLDDLFFIINNGKQVNYDLYGQYATAHLQAPAGVDPKNLLYEQQSTFTVEVK